MDHMDQPAILRKGYEWLRVFIYFVSIALFIKTRTPDNDMYFLAANGRYILENKKVPYINPFVVHEGLKTVWQQWIPSVVNYLVYARWGNRGIMVYGLLFFGAAIFLLRKYIHLYCQCGEANTLTIVLAVFPLLLYSNTRPTTITFLLMIAANMLLEKYRRTRKPAYLFGLPLVSLAGINCQAASWPLFFVFAAPYLCPERDFRGMHLGRVQKLSRREVKDYFSDKKAYFVFACLSFLAGFLNPYGWDGMLYLPRSLGAASKGGISEMQPVAVIGAAGFFVILVIISLSVYFVKSRDFDNILFVKSVLAVVLGAVYLRNLWFLLLAYPVVSIMFSWIAPREHELSNRKCLLFGAVYLVIGAVIVTCIWGKVDYADAEDAENTCLKAVEYLDTKEKKDIVLYNGFNNGNYLEWRGYKVYMDARPELFEEKLNGVRNIYTEYLETRSMAMDFGAFLDRYGFTHLLVTDRELPLKIYLMNSGGYELVVSEETYMLYEVKGFGDDKDW